MAPKRTYNEFTEELLLLARKNRFRALAIGIITFIICIVLFKLYVVEFKSELSFIIDESNPVEISTSETERVVLAQLNSLTKNRMFLLMFSDEMAKRLDNGIQIGKHYGYDRKDKYFYRDILAKMRKKINFSKQEFSTVTIQVSDYNMEYAASIANAIFENLKEINRETVNANLRYKMGIYNSNINKLELKNSKDMETFTGALSKLEDVSTSRNLTQNDILFMKSDLLKVFSQYNNSSLDLKKEILMYQITSDVSKDSTLQNMYLLNKAYPQRRLKAYISSAIYSLGVSLVVAVYYIVMLYFIHRNKHYIHLLIHGEKVQPAEAMTGSS